MPDFLKPVNEVERALADFFRMRPVLLKNNKTACLILSVEGLEKSEIDNFRKLSTGKDFLLLTGKRAKAVLQKDILDDVIKLYITGKYEEIPSLCGIENNKISEELQLEKVEAIDKSALKLARLAERIPALLVSYVNQKNTENLIREHNIISVSAESVDNYENDMVDSLMAVCKASLTLKYAKKASIEIFRSGSKEHYAITVGKLSDTPLVRIHSSCFTGDLLNSLKCDCHDQLHESLKFMNENGGGVVLYLMQEGRGIGLANKLRAYNLQSEGMDTVDANEFLGFDDDERPYGLAAKMLNELGIRKVKIITNNPRKVKALEQYGIQIKERVPLIIASHEHNDSYIETKFSKLGHMGEK